MKQLDQQTANSAMAGGPASPLERSPYPAMERIPLSPKWRHALELLADAGEGGIAERDLLACEFSAEMLHSLVQIGLAAPTRDVVGRPAWLRITDTGRWALILAKGRGRDSGPVGTR
jgi:hypothetical protein